MSMPYIIKSTERLRKSCAEMETKALLYLMNFRTDSNEMFYFVVDFFNDISGMDRYASKIWDVQSKANKKTNAKSVGQELVTLFKNFLSCFNFAHYILFIGGVADTFRKDNSISIFGMENVNERSRKSIEIGLTEEARKKEYIDDYLITDDNINKFLKCITFVIDDKSKAEYVKEIIKQHPKIVHDDNLLEGIFNEIRDKQSNKKNTLAEDITLSSPDEALNYCRHLTNNEIRLMVLHRIINKNPVERGSCPLSFISIYDKFPPENQKEKLEECVQSLCRALFNKNETDAFWALFESIYDIIVNNPYDNVQDIFQKIDINIRNACTDFDILSLKYFIAVIKDGIQNGN